MTPYEIQLLIKCCVCAEPEKEFPPESELLNATLGWMSNEDLIDFENHGTERAKVWLEAICKMPLPVQKWVIPEANKEQPA